MIVAFVFIFAIAYAYLIPSMNKITDLGLNKQVDAGKISEQTVWCYNFNLMFFQNSIGIGLIGFCIFGIVRAIEVSSAGG